MAVLPLLMQQLATAATFYDGPLEITWQDAAGNVLKSISLRPSDLAAMPQVSLTQRTPWTPAPRTYAGPTLRSLAVLAGLAPPARATLYALNDYSFAMPAEDWIRYETILAIQADGKAMPIEDKGPYWVLYPLEKYPDLNQQPYLSRMVWQVNRIVFEIDRP